jgi:predicted solute-binding protein
MQEQSPAGDNIHNNSHILRLGYHSRANLIPLLYPIEAGWVAPDSPWKLEIADAAPESLTGRVLDGSLDAAFLPPAALSRHGERLSPLGGWGLASEGKAETTILLAPQRLDLMDGGEVSISPEALSSTADHLLRLLLAPYYSITLTLRAPHDTEYNPAGARLLYGDEAAREAARLPGGWVAEDLGVAWFVLTGLPVVWEVLAMPRDLEQRKPGAVGQIQALMRNSRRTAQEQQATILAAGATRLGLDEARVKELFQRQTYTLGQPEQKALARFLTEIMHRSL